jgi:hypothetical protein
MHSQYKVLHTISIYLLGTPANANPTVTQAPTTRLVTTAHTTQKPTSPTTILSTTKATGKRVKYQILCT